MFNLQNAFSNMYVLDDVSDCLAFRFLSCDNDPSITVQFWIRIRGGKRILATGSYTYSNSGPGILMEYNETNQMMDVKFANKERIWKTKQRLAKDRWYLVIAQWNEIRGLQVILDGNTDAQVEDKLGSKIPPTTINVKEKM